MRWRVVAPVVLLGCCPAAASPPTACVQASQPASDPAPLTTASAAAVDGAASALAGCAGACAHIEACTGQADPRCRRDCERDLADRGDEELYRACVTSLPCDEVERSLAMDEGPLGRCYLSSMWSGGS